MNLKKLGSIVLGIAILVTSLMTYKSANAFWYEQRNDNDNANTSTDFYTWLYYTETGSYEGEYRLADDKTPNDYYHWKWDASWEKQYYDCWAYLNSVKFTNTYAPYGYGHVQSGLGSLVGTINQNTAPGGWNYFGTIYDYATIQLTVEAMDINTNTTYTGADAVRITQP